MSRNTIKFSVLTTVYNKSDFLEEAMLSVLNQSYRNFEYLVVDDCSTDESVAIAKSIAKTDDRVKVFLNRENLGDYPNRNNAISKSKYEYIKFLDADDTMMPDCLERWANVIRRYADNEPGYYLSVANENAATEKTVFLKSKELYRRQYIDRHRTFSIAPNSCVYRKSILENLGSFENERQTGDFEIAHRLSSKQGAVLYEVKHPLSEWRLHQHQESQLIREDLSVGSNYIRIAKKYLKTCRHFFTSSEYKAIQERLVHAESQALRSSLGRLNFKMFFKVILNRNFSVARLMLKAFKPFDVG